MPRSVMVLGAGMVGVSVALHLRRRGLDVALIDRRQPGEGASFGNAGLVQREAAYPQPFPRALAELRRIARNRATDVHYHPLALPGLVSPLLRYWWHSEPTRYLRAVTAYARLIATCVDEHRALARDADALELLRPIGWMRLYRTQETLDEAAEAAEAAARDHGIGHRLLDGKALAEAEPHLRVERAGAVHWTDPLSVSDPHALTLAYAATFAREGGTFAIGDAGTLARAGAGWSAETAAGPVEAESAVVALGAASAGVTRRFGFAPPTFGKRGYHVHYGLKGNAVLNRPVMDDGSGFMLAPMRAGIRLTTGAEFTRDGAERTPVQIERAEPVARALLPLADRAEAEPWMGVRPCSADMLPIIGPIPGQDGLWGAFGHGHQGMTLGPTTGRLVADMMTGAAPFVDPAPYAPARFHA